MQKLLKLLGWTLVVVVTLGVLLRFTLFETWTVPDDPWLAASIEPTLAAGDTVLLLTRGTPGFGDLVRCADPDTPQRFVVARIMGEPGDEVELGGRTVRVNGTPYNATEACAEPVVSVEHPETGHTLQLDCSRVEVGSGWHFRAAGKYDKRNDVKKKVGEGKVFLLSDNRDIHEDSRDFGTLPLASCDRRIVFRLWGVQGWSDPVRRLTVIR